MQRYSLSERNPDRPLYDEEGTIVDTLLGGYRLLDNGKDMEIELVGTSHKVCSIVNNKFRTEYRFYPDAVDVQKLKEIEIILLALLRKRFPSANLEFIRREGNKIWLTHGRCPIIRQGEQTNSSWSDVKRQNVDLRAKLSFTIEVCLGTSCYVREKNVLLQSLPE